MDFSTLLHGFFKVATWIFQSCSMFFSPFAKQNQAEVWPRFQSLLRLLFWNKVVEWVKVLNALGRLCLWQCLKCQCWHHWWDSCSEMGVFNFYGINYLRLCIKSRSTSCFLLASHLGKVSKWQNLIRVNFWSSFSPLYIGHHICFKLISHFPYVCKVAFMYTTAKFALKISLHSLVKKSYCFN